MQGEFGFTDQAGQRRAQFVGDVGVEAFELPVGAIQAREHCIELPDQGLQFFDLRRAVERAPDVLGLECGGLPCQIANRQQRPPHEPCAAGRNHQRAGQCACQQRPGQFLQQLGIGADVERQLGQERGAVRPRRWNFESDPAQADAGLGGPRRRIQRRARLAAQAQSEIAMADKEVVELVAQARQLFPGGDLADEMADQLLPIVEFLGLPGGKIQAAGDIDDNTDQAEPGEAQCREP
ncbi:hypothetical protein C666_09965 [Thauera linaloolentis 47Lol = DSM 12138]|uniref:Uncharacterized protein n=1 Tax=Thauera linaloolentis (strain DSM 12138 / JCM 21573 / CCUG 41526 / CIP 105981 / IAM 15112 / NBRC 102519 / 47Lol) TaxID=1123367 RepID=N6Y167_THAL4|nr:hypothetical protein C666_09965 [Thauera linaloolentis 47Lol = DSM 12138]